MGIAGASVLIAARNSTGTGSQVLFGDTLIILNAISYTVYFIMVRPLMKEYEPITVIRMIFTIGFVIILPFCWKEFTEIPWQVYSAASFMLLALIIIGGTFLAYIFNVYGIKILGASMAGTYIYVQPVFAATIAVIFFGESLEFYKIIAAIFIFAGVYFTNKSISNA